MLDQSISLALDPVELMRASGMDADPWQARLLRSRSRRILALCGRQTGKSTACAALALHTALFTPGSLVLLVSASLRQSSELFRKVLDLYRPVSGLAATVNESALRLELVGGSRVVSLPGTEQTIRGFSSAALIVVDEAARVPDDMYFAIRPSLAVSDGRLVAVSTGSLRSGFFFSAWTEGGDEWERYEVTSAECPRISAEFLAQERASYGDLRFRAEYGAAFVDAEGSFFDPDSVRKAFREDVLPLFPSEETPTTSRRVPLAQQLGLEPGPATTSADPLAKRAEAEAREVRQWLTEPGCSCEKCQAEDAEEEWRSDRWRGWRGF